MDCKHRIIRSVVEDKEAIRRGEIRRVWSVFVRCAVTTPHPPHNVTVRTTARSAKVSWLPAYDGGHPQHYVLWSVRQSVSIGLPLPRTCYFYLLVGAVLIDYAAYAPIYCIFKRVLFDGSGVRA